MDIRHQYDQIGRDYIEKKKEYYTGFEDPALSFFQKHIPPSTQKLLDLGCGGGSDIKFYEKLNIPEIYGFDSSSVMVEEAKINVKQPENLAIADLEKLPYENENFDVATGRFSFHYLENPTSALLEAHRVLKPGGKLLFSVPHPLWDFYLQESKKYGQKEVLAAPLFHKQLTVHYLTHTLAEYLSPEFLAKFELEEIYEYGEGELKDEDKVVPSVIAFAAIAK